MNEKKYIKLLCVLFAVVSLAMIVANIFKLLSSKQVLVALINLIAIAVTAVILFLGAFKIEADKRKIKGALGILASANIALAGFTHFSGMLNGEFDEYMVQGSVFEQYQKSLLNGLNKLDKDLYRVDSVEHIADSNKQDYVDVYHWAANEPTYARVPSVYSYYSTSDSHWNEFNECLCNNAGFAVRVISFSNDGRSRMNFLENVRYFVASNEKTLNNYKSYGFGDGKEQKDTGYYLSSNNFDTSLGYVYDKYITRSDFMNYDYLDREQILMQAAVIDDDKTAAPDADKLTDPVSDTKELQPEISVEDGISLDGNKISVSRKGAKIKLKFEEIKDSELYVSLTGFRRTPVSYEDMLKNSMNGDMSALEKGRTFVSRITYKPDAAFEIFVVKDGRRKRILNQAGQNNQANTSMEDFLYNLGYFESANGEAELIFNTTGVYTIDSIRVYSVSQQNFAGQAKKLSDNRLKIDDLGRDRIKGTVDSDGGILYLSILNSGGWKAYVDGNPVDLYSVNVGFVGMDIGPGKHDVELRYTPRGWPYSGIISIMGIACCAGVGILHKRKQRSQVK